MKSITIYNLKEEYAAAAQLVEDTLSHKQISRVMRTETMMVFEALYHNLEEQLSGTDTPVMLKATRGFGDLKITLGFEGGMMDPTENNDPFSPETQILETYYDKIHYSYRFGYNKIEIETRKSFQMTQMICLIAVLASIAAYALIRASMNPAMQQDLLQYVVIPLEQLFANAMIMIAAPVTFFSLLKNRTNAYIVSEWNDTVRRLHLAAMQSSVTAVLLAIAAAMVVSEFTLYSKNLLTHTGALRIDFSASEFISGLMPSNIIEPFITISPFPLIILAIMVAYALFSAGKYFDLINQLINAFYVVFSKLLSMIMFTMPLFLFVAFLDALLQHGFLLLLFLLQILVIVCCCLILLMLFYAARLGRAGINPLRFMRKLSPLLRENYLINSSIDAVPYNIRWCVQKLKMNRKKLQESMPIMAQINLDGNCFLITLTTLLFISFSSTDINLLSIAGIGILVLFLSMGAPNQPGSCLIGMLIVFYHMNVYTLIPLALFTEAMFGGLLNLVNVAGDIITVVVDAARTKEVKIENESSGTRI